MKVRFILFMLVLVLNINDGFTRQSRTDSLILWGIEQSIIQNYEAAESTFSKIIADEKENPQAYFFLAAVLQSKMMDFETNYWEQQFFFLLEKAESLAQASLNINKNDAWAYFYLGSAYSYRAFYEGRKKNYVSTITHGMNGISALKKVIEINPEFYDAYFGVGSYKYWRSKITRYLNWLPLLNDDREQGIAMVREAAVKGTYTSYAAINELTWMLIDYGKVTEALKWAKIGLEKYPESRFFLWGAAKSYFSLNEYEEALHIYQKILTSIQQESFNNHYNEIICYFKIAQCHYYLNQYETASRYCEQIFEIELTSEIKERLLDLFHKVDDLRNTISKHK